MFNLSALSFKRQGARSKPLPPGTHVPARVTAASVCVVNYNGEESLDRTLASVMAQGRLCAEVILVDNASTDRSLHIVESRFPGVRVIRLPENRGPAAARNAAIRNAESRHVLVMDNDVSLEPSCLETLALALSERPDAAVAMPRVLYAHDPDVVQYDGAGSHFLGLMTLQNPDTPLAAAPSEIRSIGSLVTAAFLLDRNCLDSGDPFDESFFIYLEDHDFAVRLRSRGWELLSVPNAHCYHGAGTEGLSIRRMGRYSASRVFYLIRNRWLFVLKNYSVRSLVLLAPILALYELSLFAVALKKGWLGEWLRALTSIAAGATTIARERRRTQKARSRPDRDLFEAGPIPFRAELTNSALERAARGFLDRMAAGYWRLVSWAV